MNMVSMLGKPTAPPVIAVLDPVPVKSDAMPPSCVPPMIGAVKLRIPSVTTMCSAIGWSLARFCRNTSEPVVSSAPQR
jgi:hypothetical protein